MNGISAPRMVLASVAFVAVLSVGGCAATTEPLASQTPAAASMTPTPTPSVAVEWTADAQADLVRVFSESFAKAQLSGYTESGIQGGQHTVRVFDPSAPAGRQAADKSGDSAAVFTAPERMIPAYLGEWVLNYSVSPGTVRDGDIFTTTVQNATVTVSEFRTRDGLLIQLRDFFHDLSTPVTDFAIHYEVTEEGRRVLAEAGGD